jgi:pyruvate dehydrogenase E2 component (dihydrolipoamide acetyltransferase)
LTVAELLMPSLGADMEAATLVAWQVQPGDSVKRGDVVATVETAKGIIDIEIFADGVIDTLLAKPGDEIPVGGALARYRGAGEPLPPATAAEPQPPEQAPAAAAPATPARPVVAPAPRRGDRVPASPAARRRAAELGVDLASVTPEVTGAITLGDVERTAAALATAEPRAPKDMRALIADTMSRSKREIPHYYLATTIDMRSAQAWLEAHNTARPVTERLLYGVLLIKAVARALERYPELNGFWQNGRFEAGEAINVGTAIRLRQGGLVAPALLGANEQPLPALMRALQDVVQRARGGGLRSTELSSATITVSSLGEGNVETVYPIIHAPQVAIVGFGGIAVRPWCAGNSIVAAPVITATLSADHRVSDGQRGSAFLMAVAELLQHPETL